MQDEKDMREKEYLSERGRDEKNINFRHQLLIWHKHLRYFLFICRQS